MNYGRQGIKQKKKLLNSAATRLRTKLGVFSHQIYTDISNCRCGFRLMSGTGFCTGYYFERP